MALYIANNKEGLIQEIDQAISELKPLSSFSTDSSSRLSRIPIILANNMVSLLTVPVNALDEKTIRGVGFASDESWKELLASLYRYFFNNALIAVELTLQQICIQKGYEVKNTDRDSKIAEAILEKTNDTLNPRERQFLKSFGKRPPQFMEWFDTAVNDETMPDTALRRQWRTYFEALSIARNKVSHSGSTVTEEQKRKLQEAEIPVNFNENNQIKSNVYAFKPVLIKIEEFLKSLQAIE